MLHNATKQSHRSRLLQLEVVQCFSPQQGRPSQQGRCPIDVRSPRSRGPNETCILQTFWYLGGDFLSQLISLTSQSSVGKGHILTGFPSETSTNPRLERRPKASCQRFPQIREERTEFTKTASGSIDCTWTLPAPRSKSPMAAFQFEEQEFVAKVKVLQTTEHHQTAYRKTIYACNKVYMYVPKKTLWSSLKGYNFVTWKCMKIMPAWTAKKKC